MEVIITIGIIAILAAIAIPSLINANKSLSRQQEDDYAKSVYLAAQNNLATMRTDGSIELLSADSAYNSVFKDDSSLDDTVVQALSEYGELAQKLLEDSKHEYAYITNDNASAFEKILPSVSIDSSILNRKILIVFNRYTGDVFLVRYGEHGIYSGSIVNRAEAIVDDDKVTPSVTFSNDQECLVKINVSVPSSYAGSNNINGFYDALTYKVTVADKNDPTKKVEKLYSTAYNGDDFSFSYSGEAKLVLDSLRSGYSFESLYGQTIRPGDDVDVSVQFIFDSDSAGGKDVVFEPEVVNVTGNSLFSSITYENNVPNIIVSNGRNLANLNKINAELANDIQKTAGAKVTLRNAVSWGDTVQYYKRLDSSKRSALSFTPLAADRLFVKGSKVTFDGNGKSIINLYEDVSGKGGLFSDLYINVTGLSLVDPMISGTDNTGALAGDVVNANITNCNVTIKSRSSSVTDEVWKGSSAPTSTLQLYGVVSTGSSCTGLLFGRVNAGTVISGCSVSMTSPVPASGGDFGLIAGAVDNAGIKNVTVNGLIEGGVADKVGLIAGNAVSTVYEGITLEGAINNTNAVSGNVGGLAGILNSCTVSTKSAKVSIDSVKAVNAGYLAGQALSSTFKNVTAEGTVSYVNGCKAGAIGVASAGTYEKLSLNSAFLNVESSDIGGLAGNASAGGAYSGLTVETLAGDTDTVNGISGSTVGGLFGAAYAINVAKSVDGTENSVNFTYNNISSGVNIGGVCGITGDGSFSGIKADGTMRNVSGSRVGGFSGNSTNGSFSSLNISSTIADTGDSTRYVGGISGSTKNGTYTGITSDATITDVYSACVGGISGSSEGGTFSNLNAVSNIGSTAYANTSENAEKNIHGCHVGGLMGYTSGVITVSGTNTVKDTFANFKDCASIGGAFGTTDGGRGSKYSGITVSGSMNNMIAPYIGGAVGNIVDGTFSDIRTAASINIQYVWSPSRSEGDADILSLSDLSYACPAYADSTDAGYAGEFVGFLQAGSMSDCSAECRSSGSSAAYSKLHFLGVVKPTIHLVTDGSYESTSRVTWPKQSSLTSPKVDPNTTYDVYADEDDPNTLADESETFVYEDKDNNIKYTWIQSVSYCTYDNVSLKNCTYMKYADSSDTKGTKYQVDFKTDRYFYTPGELNKGNQWAFVEMKNGVNCDYQLQDAFIIVDTNRKYMIGVKLGKKLRDDDDPYILGNTYYDYKPNSKLYFSEKGWEKKSTFNQGYYDFDTYQVVTYPLPDSFTENYLIRDTDCKALNVKFLDMYTLWRFDKTWYQGGTFDFLALEDATIKNCSYESSRVNDLNLTAWLAGVPSLTTDTEKMLDSAAEKTYCLLDSPSFFLGTTEAAEFRYGYGLEDDYTDIYREWGMSELYGFDIQSRIAIDPSGNVYGAVYARNRRDTPDSHLHLYALRADNYIYYFRTFTLQNDSPSLKICDIEVK